MPASHPSHLPVVDASGGPHPSLPHLVPRGSHHPALAPWAAAVGPVVFHPLPGELMATHPPLTSVRFLTWNLRVGAADLRSRVMSLRRDGAPFVLLLQEALRVGGGIPYSPPPGSRHARRIADPLPPGRTHDEIVSVALELGLALLYVPSMRNGGPHDPPEDRGNAILSSLPLEDPEVVELPPERQRRTVAGARVRATDGNGALAGVHLLSVHLENRAPWRRLWRTPGAARRAQARTLIAALPPEDDAPRVLGGDLNSWWGEQREPAVRELRTRYPHPAHLPALPTHHWELGLDRQSDYLLFRLPPGWSAEATRLDDEGGSDHWPVEGRITRTAP